MRQRKWRRLAVGISLCLSGFQVALAAGVPWGSASWGGVHSGTLPHDLRIASAGAGAFWLLVAAGLARPATRRWPARWAMGALTIVAAASAVLNALSSSPTERLWAPVSLVLAVACWKVSRVRPDRCGNGIRK